MNFFNMDLLYVLEDMRTPFLDTVFSAITQIGGESIFLVIALIMLWCIDKKKGYYLLTVCFIGIIFNQALKLIFRIPRPWVRDADFTIVESARDEATGYSFPSGHSQNVTGVFGSIARTSKRLTMYILSAVIIALVMFSRMYLGVHTLADISVSFVIGAILVFAVYPLFYHGYSEKRMYMIISIMLVLSAAYTVFVHTCPWRDTIDEINYFSALKSGYTMIGCTSGILCAFFFDRRFIHYKTEAPLLWQIIKVTGGTAIILGARILLKEPLNSLMGMNIGTALRYFIMVILAAAVWPVTFRFMPKKKISIKKQQS